jgi:serine/threonine protein kinase
MWHTQYFLPMNFLNIGPTCDLNLPHFLLQEIQHPFLVDLVWADKDKNFLFMLFPYVAGGELFSYLRR